MKAWLALLAHELRNSRSSLLAAAFLQLLILWLVHRWANTSAEATRPAAIAIEVLTSLWTLHLAADSFAGDLASGRLGSRALLPISAGHLWSAKLACLALSIAMLAGFAIACECGVQAWLGGTSAIGSFLIEFQSISAWIMRLALIAAVGMLSSLLVTNALTALLLSGLSLLLLWGLQRALVDAGDLVGKRWDRAEWTGFGLVVAAALLALGLWAFARGQRRLGAASVRGRTVLIGVLLAMTALGGSAAAAAWRYGAYGLHDRNLQSLAAIASPDGRFFAFETQFSFSHDSSPAPLSSVWVMDVERAKARLIAWPGRLLPNDFGGFLEPWSNERGLQVTKYELYDRFEVDERLRLDVEDGELRERSVLEPEHATSPHLPDWAQWTHGKSAEPDSFVLRVRWKGTELERVFRGDWRSSSLVRGVVLSPTPGRALARRDRRLVLVDFEREQEQVLIEALAEHSLLPSPDARAVLVRTETHTHVLSTVDGSPLHAPWSREEWTAEWIHGDEVSHELLLRPHRTTMPSRVVDLEQAREFELWVSCGYVTRLADRGYVLCDEHDSLIWIDRDGEPVKTLLDRSRR